jgi:NifU-like N terminal domain
MTLTDMGYRVGAPACGDVMKLQIRVDENGRISDVKFKTFGCGSAIASSSFMTERVKGLTLEEAGAIKNTEVAKELCLPPVKRNRHPTRFELTFKCIVQCWLRMLLNLLFGIIVRNERVWLQRLDKKLLLLLQRWDPLLLNLLLK